MINEQFHKDYSGVCFNEEFPEEYLGVYFRDTYSKIWVLFSLGGPPEYIGDYVWGTCEEDVSIWKRGVNYDLSKDFVVPVNDASVLFLSRMR